MRIVRDVRTFRARPPVQDRRTHSRVAVKLPCKVKGANTEHSAVLVHLSLGGAFVHSTWCPAEGERVTLLLSSPRNKGLVQLEATVLRVGNHTSDGRRYDGFVVRFDKKVSDLLRVMQSALSGSAHFALPGEPIY